MQACILHLHYILQHIYLFFVKRFNLNEHKINKYLEVLFADRSCALSFEKATEDFQISNCSAAFSQPVEVCLKMGSIWMSEHGALLPDDS